MKVLVAVLLCFFLASCYAKSAIRVAHASPDAPAVDVWVNGTRIFGGVSLYQVSQYSPVTAPNTYNIKVVPAGKTEPVVIDATITVADDTPYTVAAINKLANIQPKVFVDDLKFPPVGHAQIRFVHLSPDAPAVDIAVKNGPTLFRGVKYQQATDYVTVPLGSYDVQVKVAGTNTVALEVPSVVLNQRAPYTAWAEGLVKGGTLRAVLSQDL